MTTEFGEQRETFRRCTNAKTELGQFRNPGYKAQVKRLQQNKRANSGNYQMQEHMKNLAALRQRCQDVGNALDRKKNPYDPLSNPVRLFRKN